MVNKRKVVIAVLVMLMAGGSVAIAGESCGKLLSTTCLGCHENDRICEKIGKSTRYWKSALGLMVSNGAEISDDEVDTLNECLSQSLPEAKAACEK